MYQWRGKTGLINESDLLRATTYKECTSATASFMAFYNRTALDLCNS